MRIRRYEISPKAFPLAFTTGTELKVIKGIPEGAEFRGYTIDHEKNVIVLFLEHPSFDDVPEGEVLPGGIRIECHVIRTPNETQTP